MATKAKAIEVYARPVGYMQWACPHCHELFGAMQIPWRKAKITCTGCNRSYRLGIGFNHAISATLPPFNAKITDWVGEYVNSYQSLGGSPAIARMRGRLDWKCPKCGTGQSGQIGRDFMDISCLACKYQFYLCVIFYRAPAGTPVRTPLDWVVTDYYENSTTPIESLLTETVNTSK